MTYQPRITPFTALAPDTPVTLETLVNRVATDPSLSPTRRRDNLSAARLLADWLCRPPSAIDLRSHDVGIEIQNLRAPKLGVSEKRLKNVLSLLRTQMRRYGIRRYWERPCDTEWRAILDLVPRQNRLRYRVSRWISYCTLNGVPPDTADDLVIPGYTAYLEGLFVKNIPRNIRDLCNAWNNLAASVPGWPQQRFTAPNRRPQPSHLPLDKFLPSFQIDYEHLRERLLTVDPLPDSATSLPVDRFNDFVSTTGTNAGKKGSTTLDPLSDIGLRNPLAATTADVWMRCLHYGASVLVSTGVPIDQVVDIATLVAPDNARRILTYYFHKAGDRTTPFTGHLAYVLKRVAQIYVNADPGTIKVLADYFTRMQPKNVGLSDKNAKNLRDLDDRGKALLLAVPDKLVKRALQENRPPRQMAVDLKIAAVVGLVLYAPIRGENLCAIRHGHHLTIPHDSREEGRLHFDAHEVKNKRDITLTVPPAVVRIIRRYMAQARPLLMDPTSPMLFPVSQPKGQDFLNKQVKDRVCALTGLNVNLHLFRHIAAKMYLDDHPGEYEVVRNLLGHKRIQTTIRFYCGLEREAAIRHFQNELQKKANEASSAPRRRRTTKLAPSKNPTNGGNK